MRVYPRGWLHNAGVYGLLRALEISGKDPTPMLNDDGSVDLDPVFERERADDFFEKEIELLEEYEGFLRQKKDEKVLKKNFKSDWKERFKRITDEFREFSVITLSYLRGLQKDGDPAVRKALSLFASNKTRYPNLLGKGGGEDLVDYLGKLMRFIEGFFSSITEESEGNEVCALCGRSFDLEDDLKSAGRFYTTPVVLSSLSPQLFGGLASWERGFPNDFWNMRNERYICRTCSAISLFNVFTFEKNGDIFINAPSFKAIWILNRSASLYSAHAPVLLGLSIVESALKIQRILGAWARQNMELVRAVKVIDSVYETTVLPPDVIDALFDPSVSYILKRIGEYGIFEIVVKEDIERILGESYKSLKESIKKAKDLGSSALLPELYLSLSKYYKGVRTLLRGDRLREIGKKAKGFFNERMLYRLLELVRLGKRNEAYHLVLRTYMTNGVEFPKELNEMFTVGDDENFKALAYSFISGMVGGEE